MQKQQYIHNRTIEKPGMTIRIFSPILTEEERNKRMKAIHKAAVNLLLSAERAVKR